MSLAKDIAEQSANICVGFLSLAMANPSMNPASLLIPVAAIGGIGANLYLSSQKRTCDRAVERVIRGMEEARVPREHLQRAVDLLKDAETPVNLDPRDLAKLAKDPDARPFNEEIVRRLMAGLPTRTGDADALSLVETALMTAVGVCRRDPEFHQAFSAELLIDAAETQGITLTITQEMQLDLRVIQQDVAEIREGVDEILRRLGGAGAVLADPEALSLAELQALAANFGEAAGRSKGELVDLIKGKAQEHAAFVAEIEAINERTAGLGNLKAAAKAAAEKLDFAEVENLLSKVSETEIEIAAETLELRADNALLRNRPEEAYRLLSAAADSFAVVEELEPARRAITSFGDRLYRHGLHYGGTGLSRAGDLWGRFVTDGLFERDPYLWAGGQNNLGNALKDQGVRLGGEAGAALLAEAVAAYRAALRVWTEAEHPKDWAMAQNNLAIALRNQSTRLGGEDGAALLAEAVAAYRSALRVYTEAEHPVDWAITQNNLGAALQKQGTRLGGEAGAALLGEAVAAYRAALHVWTEVKHPVNWATAQHNLGCALRDQGARLGGEDGAALLAEAVAAFRAALLVRTEANSPVQWAMTMENIALTEVQIADHETCADPSAHLRAALEAVTAALRVYDPEHMPYDFETATKLKLRLEARLREGA